MLTDVVHAGDQREHPPGDVFALFKLAFGDGAVCKAHAVLPQNGLHRDPQRLIEQIVLFAPEGEVLAAVHDAGQGAGDGKGGKRHLLVGQQAEHGGDRLRQTLHAPLGEGDIQPGQTAAGLFSCGVFRAAAAGKRLQLLIPALGAFIVHGQSAEHAHPLHQRGGGEDLLLRQAAVIGLHFAVVPHAGVQLRVADQKLGDLGVVAAPGVAVQRVGIILLQLVVEPAPAEQGLALFLGIFPLHCRSRRSSPPPR